MARSDQLRFWAAVAVLGIGAMGMQVATSRGSLRLIKKALPIRKPLRDMDRQSLRPLEFLSSQQLKADVLEELGTREYLDWLLAAPGEKGQRPRCTLSVTYYTGVQDQVPHVPEECLRQGGRSMGRDETYQWEMKGLGRVVPVRRLTFVQRGRIGSPLYVYYTICVNGDFFGDRNRVRFRMADPRDSHLYYSKVEFAIQEYAVEDERRFDELALAVMDRALTELVTKHWPPAGWERGGPPTESSGRPHEPERD